MSDDLTQRGAADRVRINLHEKHELEYWTKKLRVSVKELHEAVKAVGLSVAAVRKHLGK